MSGKRTLYDRFQARPWEPPAADSPSLASVLPVDLWRAVTAFLWEGEALALMQTCTAALAAVGPAVETLHVDVGVDAQGSEPEAIARLLGRLPDITWLRATTVHGEFTPVSEERQLALLKAMLGESGGRRLRCVRHDLAPPSPASAQLIRQVYGSALLPELEELRLEPSLSFANGMDQETLEGLTQEVGEMMADVVEARRSLGLPGLRELSDSSSLADSVSLCRIYSTCFTTLRDFSCGGSLRINMLATLMTRRQGDGPIALERLHLTDLRYETEPEAIAIDDSVRTIAQHLGSGTAPQLVKIELHAMRGRRWPKALGQALEAGALPQLRELSLAACGIHVADYAEEDDEDMNQLEADAHVWLDGFACVVRGLRCTPLLRLLGLSLLPADLNGEP